MKKILENKIKTKIEEVHKNISLGKTLPGFQLILANAYSQSTNKVIAIQVRNTELYKCKLLFLIFRKNNASFQEFQY